ncbi:MAG: nitrilase-related carbon-nitrogen hydrolase, partial [Bdellovibrionales bacterium]
MRVALAQINSFLGGFEANAGKIISYISKAHNRHCDLVVFPEAALFGYYPMDLLERPSLVAEQEKWIRVIHRSIPNGVAVLVGAFVRNTSKRGKPFWNAAVLLEKGKKARIFAKELLPSYDVFDESRHIQPGQLAKNIFRHKGKRILITICEDIWGWERRNTPGYSRYSHNPIRALRPGSVDFAINLSASPFTQSKLANRRIVTRLTAIHLRCPLIYVNMVGAQDELIYDGGSFALNEKGRVFAQCVRFEEELGVVDLEKREGVVSKLSDNPQEILRSALVLGLREFVHKTGFRTVHLG